MKYCDTCHSAYPPDFTTCPKDQSALRATSDLLPGMVLRGKYEILERIGAGGMAAVYRARHLAFGEERAVKVVNSRLMEDPDFLKRFRTEAVVTRKLQHPNAVRVDDLDTTEDGRPFIVMEYVSGRSLRDVIRQDGMIPLQRALDIAAQVCAALGAAHALGITHRDIKPDNIMLLAPSADAPGQTDVVKVLDFGIAKVREGAFDVGAGYTPTETGMVMGTPQYMSPEQGMGRRGDQLDGRADLYSLGVVLYEMVTGRLPFESDTPMGLIFHHVQTAPTPPHILVPRLQIPGPVSMLLMHALQKEPARRFADADTMRRALLELRGLPEPPAPRLPAVSLSARTGPVEIRHVPTARQAQTAIGASTGPTRVMSSTPRPTRISSARAAVEEEPAASASWVWVMLACVVLTLGGLAYWKSQQAVAPAPVAQEHTQEALPRSAPAPPIGGQASDPSEVDLAIRTEVERAFANSETLRQEQIQVQVTHGLVILTGRCRSVPVSQLATGIAMTVHGVQKVFNTIVVDSPVPAPRPSAAEAAPPDTPPERPSPPPQGQGADSPRVQELMETGMRELQARNFPAAIEAFEAVLAIDARYRGAQIGVQRAREGQQGGGPPGRRRP